MNSGLQKLAQTVDLNSKNYDYGILLLDEGAFIHYHFVSGTMQSRLSEVLFTFRILTKLSKKVIVMQYRLPDPMIDFYCRLMNVDPRDRNMVTKRKYNRPTVLQPLSTVISTTEYQSSKLCCICDEPIVHSKKSNGKVNFGAVLCANPDYIGRQHLYAIRSRDTNAGVDILKTGLYKMIKNDDHPSFSRKMKEDAIKKLFHGSTQFGKLMSSFLSV
ncbi:hypothetical protein BCV72DRAFT_301127 [Rhizopus microsporus var. microsporus]|uniref:Uncharacterized protein n=2 Tax=Rhizopus microsporus TaxID=58291 RepID=A0A2G4SJK9_RHIZD|nr:uncharacterized protein RHIMIDRAFT_241146 [Rhizopus microsporus ATCC 52813]ORE11293.1 hypothetical protein BCV72DRAFT_301127 [Rhizopus microsporus var. microsporus]PHZ08932.1 hypothetical protein RHIMIDRAFT_241146 [Rhizopus microsporus ATCC 52813]